jgi:hypothetical protein
MTESIIINAHYQRAIDLGHRGMRRSSHLLGRVLRAPGVRAP